MSTVRDAGDAPAIAPARFEDRLRRAADGAASRGLSALLIGVGADLRYLAGYNAVPLERLTMLVVPGTGRPTLVVPRLEAAPARSCPAAAADLLRVATWEETDDPLAIVATLVRDATRESDTTTPSAAAVGVSDRLWATFVLGLQRALPETRFELASSVLRDLRAVKDPEEVALLRLAARAADRVVVAVAGGPLVGRTEESVAHEVRDRLIAEGHQTVEFAIVGSGPHSASPHHEASSRTIGAGEPIVLDIGGTLGGYCSDVTRTLWTTGGDPAGGPPDSFLELYAVLQAAQAEATAAVRPGVAAERIDGVAREIIGAAGHGDHFVHRTGHGIGLEAHEDPYVVAGNTERLREGMAFSVEPGIYIEDVWGARIEDIVVCGPDGPLILNDLPRELLLVDG